MTKTCTKCGIDQELFEFRKDKTKKDGRHSACNTCNNKWQREWYLKNKDKARQQANKSYKLNREKILKRRKQARKTNPEKFRLEAKKRYNPEISKEHSWKKAGIKNMNMTRYRELYKKQEGKCAICKKHSALFKRKLNVDHNHQTGEVRGLLCDSCNRGIGYLRDSIELLQSAKDYLICHN